MSSSARTKPSFGEDAREYLAGLISKKIVEIRGYGLDREDRLLGVLFCGETNVNLEMVRAGLAKVCPQRTGRGFVLDSYWEAEAEARRADRGIWSRGSR